MIISLVVFCVIVPLLSFVVWLCMWLIPLRLSQQKKLFFIGECLASWSSLDVLVIAIVLMTMDVEKLIIFVSGNKYDAVDSILEYVKAWDMIDEAQVLSAEGIWCTGLILLAVAAVLANVVYITMYATVLHAIKDRERNAWLASRYVMKQATIDTKKLIS